MSYIHLDVTVSIYQNFRSGKKTFGLVKTFVYQTKCPVITIQLSERLINIFYHTAAWQWNMPMLEIVYLTASLVKASNVTFHMEKVCQNWGKINIPGRRECHQITMITSNLMKKKKNHWFDPQLGQFSFQGLMIVFAAGFTPLSPLNIVLKMLMWESSKWLGKNIVLSTGYKNSVLPVCPISFRLFPFHPTFLPISPFTVSPPTHFALYHFAPLQPR